MTIDIDTKNTYYKSMEEKFIEKNKNRWKEYKYLGGYTNSHAKVKLKHLTCGTTFEMVAGNFSTGHGCPVCARTSANKKLSTTRGSAFLDWIAKSDGEYVLASRYTNSRTPVRVFHRTCGRVFSRIPCTIWGKSFSGELCTLCSKDNENKKKTYSVEQANKRLRAVNPEYEFLSYTGAGNDAVIRHTVCGNSFNGKGSYFLLGDGHCPFCTTNISKEEREVLNWFKSVCPDAEQTVRSIPGVSEIDIYSPSAKVGIEVNGHYWHSLNKVKDKNYHRNKSLACEKQGIRLIHVWDYEWEDERKQKVLKNIILGAVKKLPNRVYARECEVKEYENGCARWQELNDFFAQNNIQGNRGGSFVYTLEKDGEILMAYKFGAPSGGKAKQKYQYEMVRGASKLGTQVIGGATRLWKHFIKEKGPDSVVYYIDYNYFNGNSVEKIGLKYIGGQAGVKNYWVKEKIVKNREPRRHKEIKEKIENGEILELWNAGVKTYVYKK